MRFLRVGIVSESEDNIAACREYCKLILAGRNILLRTRHKRYDWGTKIVPNRVSDIVNYYSPKQVDCVIILTDSDGDNNCYKELHHALNKIMDAGQDYKKYVIAIPHPTIEKWFISDIKALNNALKLSSNKPPSNVIPKKWLEARIGECGLTNKTHSFVYPKIASLTDLSEVAKDPTFNRFAKEFGDAVFNKKRIESGLGLMEPIKLGKRLRAAQRKLSQNKMPMPNDRRR